MKIAFGMIVFNGDYVLKQCLDQVYPFASQILIAEGPVRYWQQQGYTTSTDQTNNILDNFPDPENKIKIIHGQYSEKDEQCQAYMQYINDDIDYIWNLDCDEVYKTEDLQNIISLLKKEQPTSVGIRSCTFYGGFENTLTGFELNKDNFLRIFKYVKGSTWKTHRPPTIKYPDNANIILKHIDSETLYDKTRAQMYHYSYVFPNQVYEKVNYYKTSVSKENCIDGYFYKIYLPWVTSEVETRKHIEEKYRGVHEFKPEIRGECYTTKFQDKHPSSIERDYINLKNKLNKQLKTYIKERSAWYNEDILPQQMLEAADGKTWGFTLESAPHFNILQESLSVCLNAKTLIDIGCGAGEVGRVFTNFDYTGCDLEHIIKNVSKKKNPQLKYFEFDAYETSFEFCKDYDVILCNGFLSELVSGASILEKILQYTKKYIVIHRQVFLNDDQNNLTTTYGGLQTYDCSIGAAIFKKLVKNRFKPLYDKPHNYSPNLRTIVMERIT